MDIDLFHIPNPHMPRAYEVSGDTIRVRDPFFTWQFTCSSIGLERADVIEGLKKMQDGALIQECFPTLTADQREAFISNPAVWEQMKQMEERNGDE